MLKLSFKFIFIAGLVISMSGCQSVTPDLKAVDAIKVGIDVKENPIMIDLSKMSKEKKPRAHQEEDLDEFYTKKDTLKKNKDHWVRYALNEKGERNWTQFAIPVSKSLRFALDSHKLDSSWIKKLRQIDRYKLSSVEALQVFHVTHDKSGSIESIYTKNNTKWYFIEFIDNSPIFSESDDARLVPQTLKLSATSTVNDVSEIQKNVLGQFIEGISEDLTKEVMSILYNGDATAYYEVVYFGEMPVFSRLKRLEAIHNGMKMSYYEDGR